MEKKIQKISKLRIFLITTFVILLGITIFRYSGFKRTEVMYCHFENNITNSSLPRHECLNMKILTKDMDKINFTKLKMPYKCYDNPEELADCSYDKLYFSKYSLNIFCRNCSADGVLCIGYQIDFYLNDVIQINLYEKKYAQYEFNSTTELRKALVECDRR